MFKKYRQSALDYIHSITIEPVIFFFLTGTFILNGAQVPTNILLYKVCRLKLNESTDVCNDLQSYPDIQDQVQIRVNNFLMISQWIAQVPGLIFAIYAGALSDEFGRKPLMTFPIIGFILSFTVGLINFAFIETLPLEFFYLDSISALLGGMGIYYLGVYGYGSSVSKPEERAHRLARLDGTETIAIVFGTLISPLISKHLGYFGNYGFSLGFTVSALLYLKFFVREPIKNKRLQDGENVEKKNVKVYLKQFLITPPMNMIRLITKKRKRILNFLIFLQLAIYNLYIFVYYGIVSMVYLYMLKIFEPFGEADYAYFSVYMGCLNAFFLMFVMPIVSGKFQMNDSLLLVVICGMESVSYVMSPFTDNLAWFYAAQGLSTMGYCKYALGRSVLSKSVEPNEVGKIFSIMSVTAAIVNMICNPVVKQLYNGTITTFPGSVWLLCSSLVFVAGIGNLYIYSKRDKVKAESTQIENDETKISTIEHTKL